MDTPTSRKFSLFLGHHGTGQPQILTFHGFGQTGAAFTPWIGTIPGSILMVDLPGHGQSERYHHELAPELLQWFDELTQPIVGKIVVVGFSLGSRVAIHLAANRPEKIARLILLAPDSLPENPFYSLAVRTPLKAMFNWVVRKPMAIISTINGLNKLGFFKGIKPVVTKTLKKESTRQLLYYTWTHFKELGRATAFNSLMAHPQCPTVEVVLGSRDAVIKAQKVQRFLKKYPTVSVKLLDSAHHTLIRDAAKILFP